MKNNFSKKSELMLKEKTLNEIKFYRSDFSEKWLHKEGSFFKIATVMAWIVGIYNLIIFAAQTMGFWIVAADNNALVADARNASIILALVVLYLVLLFFKKHFAFSVVTLAFAVFYLSNTTLWTEGVVHESSRLTSAYLFIPATVLALVPAIYMMASIIADKIIFNRTFNKLVEKIIATYPSVDGEVTTESEWDERIEKYVLPAVHEKPKKSLRKRLKKNQSESE